MHSPTFHEPHELGVFVVVWLPIFRRAQKTPKALGGKMLLSRRASPIGDPALPDKIARDGNTWP